MSEEVFAISWFGGPAERRFRRLRPDCDELPWASLDPTQFSTGALERARLFWTQSAISEYRAAARFSAVLRLCIEAKAPLDLVGMGSDFVTDELVHTELAARMAMTLGGASPVLTDYETLGQGPGDDRKTARQRADAAVVTLSCIQEGFNQALLAEELKFDLHPLVRAEMTIVARDEARHAGFGWHYLEWAEEDLEDASRAILTQDAQAMLRRLPLWGEQPKLGPAEDIALGMIGIDSMLSAIREQVQVRVIDRLAEFGITLSMD